MMNLYTIRRSLVPPGWHSVAVADPCCRSWCSCFDVFLYVTARLEAYLRTRIGSMG